MVTAHSKHTQDAQFHTGASVHIRNVSGASLHKSPPQKWHHYSMQYFHVPATVLQSSSAGGNSSAPMPESREQVESSMGSCSCNCLRCCLAWFTAQKSWEKSKGTGTMPWDHLALSGKEAGGKGPLLPWHRSCVRSDGLCSPAGVDSCFHLSVPHALVQRLRVNTRK